MALQSLLICVGSELLRGKVNTHASTLSRRLLSVGVELAHEETVPDQRGALTAAIRRGIADFPLVIITGGLGPTFDDLSREAAADATGLPLERSPKLLYELSAKFRKARYKVMPPMNARQADVIRGARVIPNAFGTAPGQWLVLDSTHVVVLLPGPPRELKPMLEQFVLPELKKTFKARPRAEGHLHFVGIPESLADQKIRPIIRRFEKEAALHVDFTILAHLGLVDFDVFVEADTQPKADCAVEAIVETIRKKLKTVCYGLNEDYPLEKVIGQALRRANATIAVAESCTGGLLASQLTDLPGSSDYFVGGVVAYSDRIKEMALGIPADLLKRYGAVSKEVAQALAQNIRQRMQSTYGIGITGIAGPGGSTKTKPVGMVYIALSSPQRTVVQECHFSGARDAVRLRSVTMALDMLRQCLK